MPEQVTSASQHIAKAKRNQAFYSKHGVEGSEYPEWGVVVLFYTLLHYVQAVLAQDTALDEVLRHPQRHRTRSDAVWRCKALSSVAAKYDQLYDATVKARYTQVEFDFRAFRNVRDQLYLPALSAALKALGPPAQ